ncbi:fluoride efflux transporter CrcB [Streptomyces noursei]|uniref:fluoride efflux transporter CrcB n=1 Tax=Streptomyces noursei TaxID=1971 RepID=UPI0039AF075D
MEPLHPGAVQEPLDPDVGYLDRVRRPRRGQRTDQWPVLGAISVGGALGAVARYGASLAWPTAAGAFPWTTLVINVLGCAVIGTFMVVIADLRSAHRLVRPFFGTGVLGGFTTFSTYVVDVQRLVERGRAGMALSYLALTVLSALAAVWAAAAVTRRLIERRTR